MRIISGIYKGRTLLSPTNQLVRPTTDRIKENVFNILSNYDVLQDKKVLDLCCGSGAIGIEALSRGAAEVVFVDNDAKSLSLAKQNLQKIGAQSFKILNSDCIEQLKHFARIGEKFDFIYSDCPYAQNNLNQKILISILNGGLLNPNGILAMEFSSKNPLQTEGIRAIIDKRKYGITCVWFFQADEKENIQ